jgi:TNF receptor-associated factor 4
MICAKVLNEPHLTDCCGQHFCQACLEQWFKKQAKKICPHCRSESFTHISYIPLKRKIDVLEVYCPNQEEGCEEITKLGVLDAHKNVCGFAKVICTQGCGKKILRKDLTQHCNNECSKRMIKCKYCGLVDHYEVISGKHTTVCEEYPVTCPRGCILPSAIKRKDLAKHTESCPLEMVQCPFVEAGCGIRVLRKDLSAHMESNTQQHLIKMMTAYSQLKIELSKLKIEHTKPHKEYDKQSSQVANLTLIEPVKLTDDNSSIAFNITLSRGWTSPPFSVLDGYTFSITHKEGKKASLMLLKGKYDDQLKWPMNLPYKLEITISKPRRTTIQRRQTVATSRHTIRTVQLPDNLVRVTGICSKEIADIDLPGGELLNYAMVVRLVCVPGHVNPSPQAAIDVSILTCPTCLATLPVPVKYCYVCGNAQPSYSDKRE